MRAQNAWILDGAVHLGLLALIIGVVIGCHRMGNAPARIAAAASPCAATCPPNCRFSRPEFREGRPPLRVASLSAPESPPVEGATPRPR